MGDEIQDLNLDIENSEFSDIDLLMSSTDESSVYDFEKLISSTEDKSNNKNFQIGESELNGEFEVSESLIDEEIDRILELPLESDHFDSNDGLTLDLPDINSSKDQIDDASVHLDLGESNDNVKNDPSLSEELSSYENWDEEISLNQEELSGVLKDTEINESIEKNVFIPESDDLNLDNDAIEFLENEEIALNDDELNEILKNNSTPVEPIKTPSESLENKSNSLSSIESESNEIDDEEISLSQEELGGILQGNHDSDTVDNNNTAVGTLEPTNLDDAFFDEEVISLSEEELGGILQDTEINDSNTLLHNVDLESNEHYDFGDDEEISLNEEELGGILQDTENEEKLEETDLKLDDSEKIHLAASVKVEDRDVENQENSGEIDDLNEILKDNSNENNDLSFDAVDLNLEDLDEIIIEEDHTINVDSDVNKPPIESKVVEKNEENSKENVEQGAFSLPIPEENLKESNENDLSQNNEDSLQEITLSDDEFENLIHSDEKNTIETPPTIFQDTMPIELPATLEKSETLVLEPKTESLPKKENLEKYQTFDLDDYSEDDRPSPREELRNYSSMELNKANESSSIVSNLEKQNIEVTSNVEMKKMMSYLDELLGNLPENLIKDFSKSEYFDLYKKIMNQIGL